jgi:hypothetical protein
MLPPKVAVFPVPLDSCRVAPEVAFHAPPALVTKFTLNVPVPVVRQLPEDSVHTFTVPPFVKGT